MVYYKLASWYDDLMEHVPYDNWVKMTKSLIDKYNLSPKKIVDLGCGTGEIAIQLAKEGYQVTGVDISEEMLTYSMQKQMLENVQVDWVQQNIVNLEGFKDVDLFISFLDVINYITNKEEVKLLFNNVYTALNKNGVFLFDIHDANYAKDNLMDSSFVDHTDQVTYIWECESDKNKVEMTHYLSFFVEQENGLYERFDEEHTQMVIEAEQYERMLYEANFSEVVKIKNLTRNCEETDENGERNLILAIK